MSRLKSALEREYEGITKDPVTVYNPKNLEPVTFHFRGEKMAKVSFLFIFYVIVKEEIIVIIFVWMFACVL